MKLDLEHPLLRHINGTVCWVHVTWMIWCLRPSCLTRAISASRAELDEPTGITALSLQ